MAFVRIFNVGHLKRIGRCELVDHSLYIFDLLSKIQNSVDVLRGKIYFKIIAGRNGKISIEKFRKTTTFESE